MIELRSSDWMAFGNSDSPRFWVPSAPRKGGVRIGSMKGKWRILTEEEDRAMDEEIVASISVAAPRATE